MQIFDEFFLDFMVRMFPKNSKLLLYGKKQYKIVDFRESSLHQLKDEIIK